MLECTLGITEVNSKCGGCRVGAESFSCFSQFWSARRPHSELTMILVIKKDTFRFRMIQF